MTLRSARISRARVAAFAACALVATDATVAQRSATHEIRMEGVAFAPAAARVRAGDTVVWVNKDAFPHTATAAQRFDSGEVGAGSAWKLVTRAKGTFSYVCTYHPTMRGTLIVE